jgi:arylsulfatase A-like enzyme
LWPAAHSARVTALAWHPRGERYVASGGADCRVQLLDVAPTVLAGLGLPASTKMPGASVIAGWKDLPRVEDHDHLLAGFRWLHAEEGVDEARLKALGYVE